VVSVSVLDYQRFPTGQARGWTHFSMGSHSAGPPRAAMTLVESPSDESLMERYRSGDDQAFRELYYRHHAALHRFVSRLLPDRRSDSEDVFQETWIAVIRARRRYVGSARFATYLFSIAHRKVADRWRHWYRTGAASELDPGVAGETPESEAVNLYLGQALQQAVSQLPLAQREAFMLKAEGGLSIEEIADITGVSRETAKSRIRYALDKLRSALEHWT
jgi:RNA polymerase sigma-70 factor, ECF subfamily